MSNFGRSVGKVAAFFALAEGGNWLLAHIASFLHLGVAGILFAIVTLAMATNSAKTRTVEDRVDSTVAAVGQINQGNMPGGVNLNYSALSHFTSTTNTTFLAGLVRLTAMADWFLSDNFTGPYWGTGERDYVNVASSKGQSLKQNLDSHGFM